MERIQSNRILVQTKCKEKNSKLKTNLKKNNSALVKTKKTPSIATPKDLDYSNEEFQMVQQIICSKNMFKMLGIKIDASNDEIKKAYKNLALKIHPDKNKAPGADEAFKKINNAVVSLTQLQSQKNINPKTAETNAELADTSIHYNRSGLSLSPFNLRNILKVLCNANPIQRRNYFNLILLMNGINIGKNDAIKYLYSLYRTPNFPIRKVSKTYQVRYFVGIDFQSKFRRTIGQIERTIEDKFIMDFLLSSSIHDSIKKRIFCSNFI